jgi:hypothetical protein
MSNNDDRYWPPTHMCEHRSRCFPATWDDDGSERRLTVQFLSHLTREEANKVVSNDCWFFQWLGWGSLGATKQHKFVIEKRSKLAVWGDVTPYLVGNSWCRYQTSEE